MTNEEICTKFMREHYSDEQLAALLSHAEDGKLFFLSCCCFVGIPTANHPLKGFRFPMWGDHYFKVIKRNGYRQAENAFGSIGACGGDPERRAAIIPLIRAEMARRDLLRPDTDFSRSALGESIIEASRRVSRENLAHEQELMAASQVNDCGDGSDHE